MKDENGGNLLEITPLPIDITAEYNFKTVIVGETGVGKSSIISKGVNNIFNEDYKATICFDHTWKNYKVNNSKIRIQLWDTCGQEVYHSLIKNFYKSALCIFLVFSIENLESFNKLSFWINEIKDNINEGIIIFLIGNKKDKEKERKIEKGIIDDFINQNKIEKYIETSAATGENINLLFETAVNELYLRFVIPLMNGVNTVSSLLNTSNSIIGNDNENTSLNENIIITENDNCKICNRCNC
jgi:small GTP-binding protein